MNFLPPDQTIWWIFSKFIVFDVAGTESILRDLYTFLGDCTLGRPLDNSPFSSIFGLAWALHDLPSYDFTKKIVFKTNLCLLNHVRSWGKVEPFYPKYCWTTAFVKRSSSLMWILTTHKEALCGQLLCKLYIVFCIFQMFISRLFFATCQKHALPSLYSISLSILTSEHIKQPRCLILWMVFSSTSPMRM